MLIIKNKINFYVFIGIMLFFFSYFPAFYNITTENRFISTLLLILFALPSFYYLFKSIKNKMTIFKIFIIFSLTVIVEAIAIITGYPYGKFAYAEILGFKIFDLVPLSIFFAYPPILIGVFKLIKGLNLNNWYVNSFLSGIGIVCVDLILDPAAVYSGFWFWEIPGSYYGVPIINFIGWGFTGFIYSALIYFVLNEEVNHIDKFVMMSLLLILFFWSGYLFWVKIFFPSILGLFYAFIIILKLNKP